jgi:hypothetical protein
MENQKQCPYCTELVNAKAHICRHCQSFLGGGDADKDGRLMRVRLKTPDKVYTGEIFIPNQLGRVSDVMNDARAFVVLSNAKEETKSAETVLGVLALNKRIIEWVRFLGSS